MTSNTNDLSLNGRQPALTSLDLRAPELHDFSDVFSTDARPNHMLRWVVAVVAMLTIGHFAFNASTSLSRPEASITATSHAVQL